MSVAGSALTAKLVLTGDNRGIVTAAEGTVVALDQVKHKAQEAGIAAAAASGEFNASAAAMRGQAEAATMANTAIAAGGEAKAAEVVRLTEMAAAGTAVTSRVHAMSAAHAEYNATIAQARGLLAANIITQAEYAEVVAASSAQLALARANTDADTAAMVVNAEACQVLSLGLRGMNLEAGAAGMGLDRLETNLAKLGKFGGVSRGVISRTRAGLAAIPEFVEAFPVLSAGTAAAAAVAVLIAAEQSYEASIGRLNVSLQAHGLAIAGTSEKYLSLAGDMAATGNVSTRTAREIEATFANANIDPALWEKLTAMSRDYAAVLGTDIGEAASKAADDLQKPYEWAVQLTQQYGLFDQATLRHIHDLVEAGRTQEAQQQVTDAWAGRIKNAADQTSGWARAWAQAKTNFGQFWDDLGNHLFLGNSANLYQQQLDFLQRERDLAEQGKGFLATWKSGMLQLEAPRALKDIDADIKRAKDALAQFDPGVQWRNRESAAISELVNGMGLSTYDQKLRDLSQQRQRVTDDYAKGLTVTGVDGKNLSQEQALAVVDREITKTKKERADAERSLNEVEKEHYERIQELLKGSPQLVAQSELETRASEGRLKAYFAGSEALQTFNDQQEISKAILPYTTALTWASGEAHEALAATIAKVTKEKKDQLAADHALAAVQEIDQGIGSASGYMSNALADAKLELNRKKLNEWYTTTAAALAQSEDAWELYHDDLDVLFGQKLANLYDEDLRNRQDWASGIIRANNDLVRSQQDWASKSEGFIKGWDRSGEDAFVSFAKTGKASIGDLTDFVTEQFSRMVYQRYVAGAMNSIGSAILSGFDNILGISGGSAVAGVHHTGGEAGYPMVMRTTPIVAFQNARVLHTGGFADDEVPAILKRRERVLTEEQQLQSGKMIDRWEAALNRPTVLQLPASAASSAGVPKIEQHFHEGPGVKIRKKETQTPDGGMRQDFYADLLEAVKADVVEDIRNGGDVAGAIGQGWGPRSVI